MNDETKKLKFEFDINHYDILTQDDTAMILECYIVHTGVNRKGTSFTLDSIKRAIPSLANKPLLIYWNYGKSDFTNHAEQDRKNLTFIGNIPETNKATIVKYQDKDFLKARCIIWKEYHPEVVERFLKNETAKISMEIDVSKYYTEEDTGILNIEEFIFTGICLLGDSPEYREGIAGANIKVMNFSDDKLEETINFYNTKYSDMTYEHEMVPKNIIERLNRQLSNPQKNYNIVQFCKYIVDEKFIPYSVITEWYSKIVGTRKSENFEYYGGKEAEQYLANIISQYAVSEDDRFKGDSIPIDLSKEAADDSTSWEDVDKAALQNKLLIASNGRDLAQKTYLVVPSDWENAPSTSLKYPVAFIKGGKLVYAVNGVQAANVRLEQNTNENYYAEARKKLNSIYKKLELNGGDKMEKENYSMDYEDLIGLLRKLLGEKEEDEYGYQIYTYYGCGEKYVVAGKNVGGKFEFVKMPYEIQPDSTIQIDFESQVKVYPKMEYIELPEDAPETDIASEVMSSIYTAFVNVKKEYTNKILEFTAIDEKMQQLQTENSELQHYKIEAIKATKDKQASELYSKYSKIISDQDKEMLNAVLYAEDKTFEEFETVFYKTVTPLLEAKMLEYMDNMDSTNNLDVEGKSVTNKSETFKPNYSTITPAINQQDKPATIVDRLADFLNS